MPKIILEIDQIFLNKYLASYCGLSKVWNIKKNNEMEKRIVFGLWFDSDRDWHHSAKKATKEMGEKTGEKQMGTP